MCGEPVTGPPAACSRCERLTRRHERERQARLEAESIAERFSRQVMQDHLTGLGSRALFVDRLVLALDRCARTGSRVGLLFLDLDDFKVVNDTLGHSAGDRMLAEVGVRLRQCTEPTDVVARLGGDEFVLLRESVDDVAELETIAETIGEHLQEPLPLDGHLWRPGCSVGIRVAGAGDTVETVLRDADTAMYVAKRAGKGRSAVFTAGTRSRLVEKVEMIAALRDALNRDLLEVWYQPLVALETQTLVGAEALSRWTDEERGMVRPDLFIGIAEESGDIGALGNRVLRAACFQTIRWQHQPGWQTHVNVHPSELADPLLPERLGRLLEASGIAGEMLCLEITEQTLVCEDEVVHRNLARLRDLGAGIAIDDFGKSYSTFALLKRLPVTALKIDRSFVDGVGEDDQDDAIVAAVAAMARALDLHVVAEGVETDAQRRRLLDLDVAHGQGWLWAPAVPPAGWDATVGGLLPATNVVRLPRHGSA